MNSTFRSGFVSIIGRPNVGKSTLMNQLVGEKLSIVTPKSSTTRHRILGIVNGENYQVVFSDTPGILQASYELHNAMMDFVWSAVDDSDLIIYLTDVEDEILPEIIERINMSSLPKLVLLNKIDLSTQLAVEEKMEKLKTLIQCDEVIPISALYGFKVQDIINKIVGYLPFAPAYFPDDQLTDKTERFFVSEIIRGKIFELYQQEIPYSSEVAIFDFKDLDGITHIYAEILVERQSQKGIIIGKGGEGIKKIGTYARRDIEAFLERKVFLDLRVKVAENWRKNEHYLKRFGYK
jgi:GTPase